MDVITEMADVPDEADKVVCKNCDRVRDVNAVADEPEIGWLEFRALQGDTVLQVWHVCPWCWEEFLLTEDAKEDARVNKT